MFVYSLHACTHRVEVEMYAHLSCLPSDADLQAVPLPCSPTSQIKVMMDSPEKVLGALPPTNKVRIQFFWPTSIVGSDFSGSASQ